MPQPPSSAATTMGSPKTVDTATKSGTWLSKGGGANRPINIIRNSDPQLLGQTGGIKGDRQSSYPATGTFLPSFTGKVSFRASFTEITKFFARGNWTSPHAQNCTQNTALTGTSKHGMPKGTSVVETFKLKRNWTKWSSSSNEFYTQTTPPSTNSAQTTQESGIICSCTY